MIQPLPWEDVGTGEKRRLHKTWFHLFVFTCTGQWMLLLKLTFPSQSVIVVKSKLLVAFLFCYVVLRGGGWGGGDFVGVGAFVTRLSQIFLFVFIHQNTK